MSDVEPGTREGVAAIPLGAIADLLISAECEIAAFRAAVTESYGAAQEELAIADWLEAMEAAEWSIPNIMPNWRKFTIAAALKLADRVCCLPSISSMEDPR